MDYDLKTWNICINPDKINNTIIAVINCEITIILASLVLGVISPKPPK